MSLPPEWQRKHSKSRGGRVFYYNKLTNETRWDCPVSAVDEADYPELQLPGNVKNVRNADHAKKIENSSNPPGQTHLNKRRRVDSKKNDNVGSSVQRDIAELSGKQLVTKQSPCTRTNSKGKTKQKQISAEKAKEKPKKGPGTKLYREASLCDLNAYLGGECVKEGKVKRSRDSVPSGGSVYQPDPKSRGERSGHNAPSRPDPVSLKKSEDVTASARLSDLKTYLEQSTGSPNQNTPPRSAKENIKTVKEGRPSKTGGSIDLITKSGAVITKTKDVKRTKRNIKSTPYSRPNQPGVSKGYKIPKVAAKSGETSSCTSQQQPNRSLKISTDKNPGPGTMPFKRMLEISSPSKNPLPGAVSLKRKLETDDIPTTSQPSSDNLPSTSQSLLGRIVSTSWNFLTRTLTSTGVSTGSQHAQREALSGGTGSLSDVTRGRGSQSTISLQTHGKSSAEYSDDDCEMMEIDEVVATVSEIRSSIHNSQSDSDSSFLAERHEAKPASAASVHDSELPENAGKSSSAVQTFFVLDTNVLIHDLSFVEELIKLSDQEKLTVVIPWIALQELDGLKSTSNVGKAARKAIDYLLECRKSRRGGVVFEPNSGIRTEVADDRILLCLEWICGEGEDDSAAVLVSCDKNLRLKADVNGFESYDVSELGTILGSSDGDSPDMHASRVRSMGRVRRLAPPTKTDPTVSTPVKPRRPKSSSVTTSPQIQLEVTSTRALQRVGTGRRSAGDFPTTRPPAGIMNSFRDVSTNIHSRGNANMGRPESRSPPAPSYPMDLRLAQFTGESSPKPEPRSDIARFDKSVLQVLDEMSGSMTVFRQQVVAFVEAKLSTPGPGITVQLTELQNFLSVLVPDVNKFLESCRAFNQVAVSQLKHNFSAVCALVSAIQSFSVHHLHYAPNIAASDAYQWLVEPGHVDHLTATERHFTELLSEIERAVDALLTKKRFV